MARPKSNSSKIAFNYIRGKINNYDIAPGETVSDFAISEELDMSRTPVREAIQQLMQYNIVERKQNNFSVKPITNEDISEIFEVRNAIECQAASRIVDNGGLTDSQLKWFKNNIKELGEAYALNDIKALNSIDSKFHERIAEFSGNSRLLRISHEMNIQTERLRWLSMLTPKRFETAGKEHEEILDAICKGNKKEAVNAIMGHLKNSVNNYRIVTSDANWEDCIISLKNAFLANSKQK
ncbi:MAG: GntR family transcriptional regulator [Bacilli bacterium]